MIFEWNENKRIINLEKHGIDFIDAYKLWLSIMAIAEDKRYDYSESRFIALGLLKNRVVVCAYTTRGNDTIRIISLRKANKREIKRYEQNEKK
ncbi:MAG: hypothetical protein ACD_29C00023G0001 [uncultured bacterium]|nr:MAG: hypothetical protein ACD_29C00023G0001 [uncultured bacterium]